MLWKLEEANTDVVNQIEDKCEESSASKWLDAKVANSELQGREDALYSVWDDFLTKNYPKQKPIWLWNHKGLTLKKASEELWCHKLQHQQKWDHKEAIRKVAGRSSQESLENLIPPRVPLLSQENLNINEKQC